MEQTRELIGRKKKANKAKDMEVKIIYDWTEGKIKSEIAGGGKAGR